MNKLSVDRTTDYLSTEDKHILRNERETILSELCDLLSLIKTRGAYVTIVQSNRVLKSLVTQTTEVKNRESIKTPADFVSHPSFV